MVGQFCKTLVQKVLGHKKSTLWHKASRLELAIVSYLLNEITPEQLQLFLRDCELLPGYQSDVFLVVDSALQGLFSRDDTENEMAHGAGLGTITYDGLGFVQSNITSLIAEGVVSKSAIKNLNLQVVKTIVFRNAIELVRGHNKFLPESIDIHKTDLEMVADLTRLDFQVAVSNRKFADKRSREYVCHTASAMILAYVKAGEGAEQSMLEHFEDYGVRAFEEALLLITPITVKQYVRKDGF